MSPTAPSFQSVDLIGALNMVVLIISIDHPSALASKVQLNGQLCKPLWDKALQKLHNIGSSEARIHKGL